MNAQAVAALTDLEHRRVDRRVYTDPDVFALEMDRLFAGTWVYVAHESQIPNTGDFVATDIGDQPVVVVRARTGRVKVFYNRCPHRGARLVNTARGCVKRFVCHFHAYSFHTDGELAGVPLEDSYEGSDYGRCDPDMRLREVAAVDVHRGFVFACLRSVPMSLGEWLGDTKATLDNFVDRSPEGEVEVVGRPYRWINRCNWKMLVENLVDGMHVGGTHPSIAQTADRIVRESRKNDRPVAGIVELAQSFWQTNDFIRKMGITMLNNGHFYMGGQVSIHSGYSEIDGYVRALEKNYGADRTQSILSQQRHNTAIYPNLHVKTMIQKLRVFKPIRPDKTIVECWAFRLKGAPEALLKRTLLYAEMLDSPGSLVSTDDLEVMMRQQSGLDSSAFEYVNFQRGAGRERSDRGGGNYYEGDSEQPFVRQFETWRAFVNGEHDVAADRATL